MPAYCHCNAGWQKPLLSRSCKAGRREGELVVFIMFRGDENGPLAVLLPGGGKWLPLGIQPKEREKGGVRRRFVAVTARGKSLWRWL